MWTVREILEWLWVPVVVVVALLILALCRYFFSEYLCCSCKKNRSKGTILPTSDPSLEEHQLEHVRPTAPAPDSSPVLKLALGTKKLSEVVFEENGVPTLDLHDMILEEARSSTVGFIKRQIACGGTRFKVVTGRGLHSHRQVPVLKPVIRNILIANGLEFSETSRGGAFLVEM